MKRSLLALAFATFAFLVGGCSMFGGDNAPDETVGWSAQKLYGEAKDAINNREGSKAIKDLEKLEARYPFGRYAQQAQLEVAYAHFKQGETASAISACDRFIRLHPNHPNIDYAYYLKGLVNFNEDLGLLGILGNQDLTERDPKAARESFDTFKELVTRFPESRYAADSAQRMNYLVNALAAHQVHVADFYLRRGAYVAAANRAQATINAYPNSPAREDALVTLIKSYDAMGMKDLRDDTERVMRANFPNSRYFKPEGGDTKPWWKFW